MLAPIALVENRLRAGLASQRIIPTSANGSGRAAQPWTAIDAPLFRPPTQRDKARGMGIADQPVSQPTQGATSGRALLLATFTAAITLSAALLFMVQPMFTKMVLPRFGGAPSVWSVAIVYFQTALLAGYAYAHVLTRYAGPRASVVIHLAVMIAAAFALPLSIPTGWDRPPAAAEALWLMGLFTASIGLPFFALAANSPLLQAWFAGTDHPAAKDPYFLYAASNVGSFLALVSYPIVIEPFVRLGDQAWSWSIGFCLLIALLAGCGGGSAPLGSSAGALSLDLRHRVCTPADHSAPARRRRPAFVHHRARYRDHLRPDQDHRRDPRRAPRGVLRQRVDVPWRACAHEAGAEIPHCLLPLDIGGRRDRRHRGRIDRTLCVQLGGGISDLDCACGAVPAGSRAAGRAPSALLPLRRPCGRGARPHRLRATSDRAQRDRLQLERGHALGRERVVLARTIAVRRDDRLHPSRLSQHRRATRHDVGAQFLRRRQDHRERGRPVPSPPARDHAPWRAAYPRSQRSAGGDRSAGTAALLLGWFRYLGDLHGGAGAPRPADPLCSDRPWHRLAGLPRRAG